MKGHCQLLCAVIFVIAFTALSFGSATNIYITPDGSSQGVCTASPHNPAWFNSAANWGSGSSQIGPGTTVHLCGTFTGAPDSTMFTFQGNGTSGSPITVLFESGTVLRAPYWSGARGGVNMSGRSFITLDGGANGAIQNTDNGDQLGNQHITTLIYAYGCSNCTVKNLTLANSYVAVRNVSTLGGSATQMNALVFSGPNWVVAHNVVHDCGWCLFNSYADGDTNTQVYDNEIYNWDHAYMYATGGANRATNFFFHDNRIHDDINWETPNCLYHLDGVHFFGTNGSSMSGQYIYNNYFYGAMSGPCSSGFIYLEGGTTNPSHASNNYFWNNVFDASGADGVNPNGWVGVFSGEGGTTVLYNNYISGPSSSDTTNCYNVGSVNNLVFQNNVSVKCTIANNIGHLTGSASVDYNFYGNPCNGTDNCFIYNGSFMGSFAKWKASSGFDAHSLTTSSDGAAKLNSDGSPQPDSPVIGAGMNLSDQSKGSMTSLAADTSRGNTRNPVARAQTGPWTLGAYDNGSGGDDPAPPSGLQATVK